MRMETNASVCISTKTAAFPFFFSLLWLAAGPAFFSSESSLLFLLLSGLAL